MSTAGRPHTLDRLDRTHGGDSRRFIATRIGQGATRAQIVAALDREYGETVTTRSLTAWLNGGDERLTAMVRELEDIKRSLAADDDRDPADLLRPTPNLAQIDDDIFSVCDASPAFAALLLNSGPEAKQTTGNWGEPLLVGDDEEAGDGMDDVRAALESDDDLETASLRLLPEDWDEVEPLAGAGRIAG